MRAVFDTNVLVSAFIVKKGVPAQILSRADEFALVLSPFIMAKTRMVLARRRIRKKYPVTDEGVDGYLAALRDTAEMVSPAPEDVPNVITADPPDNWVLATAIVGQADVIVSGNDHLLSLKCLHDVEFMTPVTFRAMLDVQAAERTRD